MKMQASVKRLLRNMGRNLTLVATTTGAYNPATTEATLTTASATGRGHIINHVRAFMADGGMVRHNALTAILDADDFTTAPKAGDRITDNSVTYEVIEAHTVKKNNTALVHQCEVRL